MPAHLSRHANRERKENQKFKRVLHGAITGLLPFTATLAPPAVSHAHKHLDITKPEAGFSAPSTAIVEMHQKNWTRTNPRSSTGKVNPLNDTHLNSISTRPQPFCISLSDMSGGIMVINTIFRMRRYHYVLDTAETSSTNG
jgi:hypothetical protein